ncbi:MAG: maltose ABC transporter substrate-binding protein [Chloroflexi bacterium]|nr:MAG: maltose ABC transporter substrate-binding protein [Chloroflexota bacterium]
MRKTRIGALFTLLVVTMLMLAACPGGAGPAQAPAAPTPTTAPVEAAEATPTEAAAEEPTAAPAPAEATDGPTLVIWADDTRSPVLEQIGADFQNEYGVRIVVTQKAFGDIRDDLKVAGPAGEGPDIIIGAHDWLGELVENGLLAEIELGENADQFLPAAIQAFTYDGALYGMPYATENVAFVYNTDLVETPPTTWSEVEELSAQIEEAGTAPQGFIHQESDPYHFFPIMTSFGGYIFGLTEEGYDPQDVGLDSEGSLAAARWLDGMYKAGHLRTGAGVNYDIMHSLFGDGEAAMMITGPWALPAIRESGVPYAVTTIPGETQDAQPFLGVQGFMISQFSDDPLLAQTFLQEYVANADTMQAIFDADPRPSAFLPVRDAIEDEDLAAFAEAGANGLPMPAIPEMSAVWSAWGDALTLIGQQREDPETAFRNAAEQVRTAISEQ